MVRCAVGVDAAWESQTWAWLTSLGRFLHCDLPERSQPDAFDEAFAILGAKSGALGSETSAHLLMQGLYYHIRQRSVSAGADSLGQLAASIGPDVASGTADALADLLVSAAKEVAAVDTLAGPIAHLATRLPDSPAVLAARTACPVGEAAAHPVDSDDVDPHASSPSNRTSSTLTEEDERTFWDSVYPELFFENDSARPLGWALLNRGLARAVKQRTTQPVAAALLQILADKAATSGSLPKSEHMLVPACVAAVQSEQANVVAEAIGIVVRQATPSSAQVSTLVTATDRYSSVVRQLLLRALTGVLDTASTRHDRARAAGCVEPAATLAEYLTQAQAKSLADRFDVFKLESSLALDELRQRADPSKRGDLSGLSIDDRTALLNASQSFQAQVAMSVCQRNRGLLLEQARTWLAQQLGSSVSTYRAPAAPHPATLLMGRNKLHRNEIAAAIDGSPPAIDRCRQALEPFLVRTRSAVAEEWDAYLDTHSGRLPDAADKWRRTTQPSPEVCWNLAVFDTGRKFAEAGAYKHVEQGLKSWRADTDMVLQGIWLALQASEDSAEAAHAARFFTTWACEVPEPRVLLAALAMADGESQEGFALAERALRQWGQLADPPALQVGPGRASATAMIDEVRKESRYTQRWQRCILAGAATRVSPGSRLTVLVALADLTEKDPDQSIASETWHRVVEHGRERLDELSADMKQLERRMERSTETESRRSAVKGQLHHAKKALNDAKHQFRPIAQGALRFAQRWRDERLGRAVTAVTNHHGINLSSEQEKLLKNLLPTVQTPRPAEIRPEIAQLIPRLTAATDPASVAALAKSVEPALAYVGAGPQVRELVHQMFDGLGRLSQRVQPDEARELLDRVGRIASQLESSDTAEESLAALLGAVRRACDFAAANLVDAPPPGASIPDYWIGLSRESEVPQAVLEVRGTQDVHLQDVTLAAGREAVQVGDLAPGQVLTVAVPVATEWPSAGETAGIVVNLGWSWNNVTGLKSATTLETPVASWDALLADAGVSGLEIPDDFVLNEPLDQSQVVSGLFQGRDEHLDRVLREYTDRLPAVPVCFHGIRKVGKSSLLNRIVVELRATGRRVDLVTAQGLQPAYQSLGATVANLCRRIALRADRPLPDVPALPDNPVMFFEEFISAYAAGAGPVPPVLMVDEFQCLYTGECAPILDIMRMAAESRQCGFIFAAVEGPSGLPQQTGLLVDPRRVDFLKPDDVTKLMEAVLDERPVTVPPDVLNALFDECAGHPNFTSATIKGALRLANAGRRNIICVNDVREASRQIAVDQQIMFETSWFSPSVLSEYERSIAIDLTHTLTQPRAWLRVSDVLGRFGDEVRSALRVLENGYVIESRMGSDGDLRIRIRGGVLERYLRSRYGARLEFSPDKSKKAVGMFIDVENVIGAAPTPDHLADQLLAFAQRFGSVVPPVAVATRYSLSLAGWDMRAVEAAFVARKMRFSMPPDSIGSRENAADMTLQPLITSMAEQYNLAEVVIVSADHYFVPTALHLLQGAEGSVAAASGRRVHVVGGRATGDPARSGSGRFGRPWESASQARNTTCQILGLDGPDLLLWDADQVLADPIGVRPLTSERFTEAQA